MSFVASEHMMKLKGKDYLQVMWRLVWFREDHPDWSIETNILASDEDHAVFKAIICDASGIQKSAGHGSESKRDFGDYLEKAETKAVGRALAMLGYGTQFAPELDEEERIVDSPVARSKPEKFTPAYDARGAVKAYCEQSGMTAAEFARMRSALIDGGVVLMKSYDNMTEEETLQLIRAVEQNRVQK